MTGSTKENPATVKADAPPLTTTASMPVLAAKPPSATPPENKFAPFNSLFTVLRVKPLENKSSPSNPLLAALPELPRSPVELFKFLCDWVTRYALDNGHKIVNKTGQIELSGKYAEIRSVFKQCRDKPTKAHFDACVNILEDSKYATELVSLGLDKNKQKLIDEIQAFEIIHLSVPKPF
jgi:hypothetical protein